MNKIMKARKGGFTLVELLIVIMIIAILAGMMMLATGAATDSAEAAKVTNDLRNVKAAAAMFFVDHNVWPDTTWNETAAASSLSHYMDRSLDARYGNKIFIKSGDDDRVLAGFNLDNFTPGVKTKLQKSARTSALFNDTGSGGGYYTGGAEIYMGIR